ncbi:FAD-dependent oxidoreductase [Leucobacter sp. wl10]|uniref:FAD-dependent oxidoreductase n=1 Tax=Leucobacter sp. wl10 TaxID=2304677 RepID=UPI000E5B7D34|nr:FAD-dependent oxidoreductase [Leucobacter sp. wl10]RGE22060.1 FAD-dependent oxidoreductase [Leucobacter sp. wl10]
MRIAIIGLGAIGSQALLHLSQQEGVQAVGYDLYSPGHGFGASGGENRLFPRVGTDYENYTELIDYALSVWERLEGDSGRTIVKRAGYLAVGDEAAASRSHIIRAAAAGGTPARILTRAQLQDEFGFQSYREGDIGAFDPTGGMIRTDAAIFEAARAAEAFGAQLHPWSRVTALETTPHEVRLHLGDQTHRFDLAVVTTGPWVHQLLPELRRLVHVHRPTSAWFLPKAARTMRGLPAISREGQQQYYAAPTFDGASLKVGYGGLRQQNLASAPEPAHTLIDPDELGEFPRILGEYLTAFNPTPSRIAHFFEGYTDSSRPIIQRTHDRVVVGVGFSGLGFKLSPVFGRLLAETATDRPGKLLGPLRESIPSFPL